MLIFRVPPSGGFCGARETYERRHPFIRPLAPSEKRRGIVILASAKRLCGYYENGGAGENEPTHGGRLFEPSKHWFFVFGSTCVLFYDPFVAAMMLFFIVFALSIMLFAGDIIQRVLVGVLFFVIVWQYAKLLNEQFEIKSLIKGGKDAGEKSR